MDAAYKKYTRPQSVKLNFIEKCSNMKVKHPKDYWLEYERKMLENINETSLDYFSSTTARLVILSRSGSLTRNSCRMFFA